MNLMYSVKAVAVGTYLIKLADFLQCDRCKKNKTGHILTDAPCLRDLRWLLISAYLASVSQCIVKGLIAFPSIIRGASHSVGLAFW